MRLEKQARWHALPDVWQEMEYQDFLVQRCRLMAQVVHDAFPLLADTGYQPEYPSTPIDSSEVEVIGEPLTPATSLHDLILSGVLAPGTALLPARDGLDATGVLNADGTITVDDVVYDSPSGAARAVIGHATNGWRFWLADTPAGLVRLDDLRQQQAEEQ